MKQLLSKRRTHYRGSVIILLVLMVLVAVTGWNVNAYALDQQVSTAGKKLEKEQTISTLWGKTQENKAKVEAIDKIKNAKQISEAELKGAIDVLFSKDQERALKVQNCENGKRIADRYYTNQGKGVEGCRDLGIWQINECFHRLRVERFFSMDFWSAMIDPARNTIFAAIKHNQEDNLSAWSCNQKVASK